MKKILQIFIILLAIIILATTFISPINTDTEASHNPEDPLIVNDITKLNPIKVARVIEPQTLSLIHI